MTFANISGGEAFIRNDFEDIVSIVKKKAKRVVINSNGYFPDRIIDLFSRHSDLGIRLSIEGLPKSNDSIRGIKDGFDRGLRTLLRLVDMGIKDIGFAMTLQDINAAYLVDLYVLSNQLKMEFATATLHNSFYFRKSDNKIVNKENVARAIESLINKLLKSNSPKKWLRANFNYGLINHLYGQPRLLPCDMGRNGFFLDPYGDVLPCNGMAEKMSMGNLHTQTWNDLWHSSKATKIRQAVKQCARRCWMTSNAVPAIRDYPMRPLWWVLSHKIKSNYRLSENSFSSPR
jgi:MoaA/NifB/PqqE/SkfB family radical SAM enzyme